jgi:hypothetical protein
LHSIQTAYPRAVPISSRPHVARPPLLHTVVRLFIQTSPVRSFASSIMPTPTSFGPSIIKMAAAPAKKPFLLTVEPSELVFNGISLLVVEFLDQIF